MQDKITKIKKIFGTKADSNLIAILIFVLLSISAIAIFWAVISNKINLSPQISCSDFELKKSLKINKACYLNENEILISLERKLDSDTITSLEFDFDNFGFLLKDKSFGCSDIRELNSEYGRACEIVLQGMSKDYVFNVAEEGNSKNIFVGVYLGENNQICSGAQKEIEMNC